MILSYLLHKCKIKFDSTDTRLSAEVLGIHDDSRKIQKGYIFVARSGSQSQGNKFIQKAKDNQALWCIAQSDNQADSVTSNPELTLELLLQNFYNFEFDANTAQATPLIAITGTNGKTSCAWIIQSALESRFDKVGLAGTICTGITGQRVESQLTTPALCDTYKLLKDCSDTNSPLVMEFSSHALHQNRIGSLLANIAVFTNLSQDHLDYHLTMEAYFDAKAKLFLEKLKPSGIAVVNQDNSWGKLLINLISKNRKDVTVTGYSRLSSSDVALSNGSIHFKSDFSSIKISPILKGDFNEENLLACATTLKAMDFSNSNIQKFLNQASIPGRLEKVDIGQKQQKFTGEIYVDYAHTPDALERVLNSIKKLTQGKLYCVFGCGGDRDRTKRPLMAQAVQKFADVIYLTSDNPRTEDPQQILDDTENGFSDSVQSKTILDRKTAIEEACENLKPEDTLVIAGKGHEDYQILGTQKVHFDDREIVRAFFNG
jgi:UDP-N-acetylmuramoyl-L-alanyl-D-glutamate--2,6-diaminopimelate ligase